MKLPLSRVVRMVRMVRMVRKKWKMGLLKRLAYLIPLQFRIIGPGCG